MNLCDLSETQRTFTIKSVCFWFLIFDGRRQRNQSALQIFRDQFIKTQKEHVQRNWLSKESWQIVRAEYGKLSPEEAEMYERAASSSNASAKAKRKRAELQPACAALAEEPQSEVGISPSSGLLKPGMVRNACVSFACANMKQCTGSVSEFINHLDSSFDEISKQKGLNPCPIGEESVLSSLLSLKSRKIPLRNAMESIRDTCEATAGPKSDQDVFPKTVFYPQHCRGICGASGFDRVKMQSNIIQSLESMASSRYAKPTDLVRDDLLLSITVSSSGIELSFDFFLVTAVAFRGGVQKPTQSYLKLCKSVDFEQDGRLHLVPSDFVRPTVEHPSPFHTAFTGALVTWPPHQLAAYLIGDHNCFQMTVTIRKHTYTDESRAALKVTGVAADWDPITFDNTHPFHAVRLRKGAKAKAKPKGAPAPPNASSGSIDMLNFFEDSDFQAECHGALDMISDALGVGGSMDVEDQDSPDWAQPQADLDFFDGLIDPDQLQFLRTEEELLRSTEQNETVEP